jgi:hypothetical protein
MLPFRGRVPLSLIQDPESIDPGRTSGVRNSAETWAACDPESSGPRRTGTGRPDERSHLRGRMADLSDRIHSGSVNSPDGEVFSRSMDCTGGSRLLEIALLGRAGGCFRGTISKGLNRCRRLLAHAGDETATVDDEQVRNIMRPVETVDDGTGRIVAHPHGPHQMGADSRSSGG